MYWLAVVMPLLMVLASFISGGWYWGLMDDPTMVALPGGIWQRFIDLFQGGFSNGRFRPLADMGYAFFYKVFAHSPYLFYIFSWCQLVAALGVWALLSRRLTGEKAAAPLFLATALSFYKTYDGFFYLSIQEPAAVLFAGIACLFLFDRGKMLWGAVFLLAAAAQKETFIAVAAAVGAAFIVKRRSWPGFIFFAGAVLYGLFLKIFISRQYSSSYSLTDGAKIGDNISLWLHKDLLFHLPWIILAAVLLTVVKADEGRGSEKRKLAVSFGVFLYAAYWLIILPWNTWGYYALPFGVFFAFLISVLIAGRMEKLGAVPRNLILIVIILFTAVVGWQALRAQFTYQRDTRNLVEWMAENPIFEHEVQAGSVVRANADEACYTIPEHLKMLYGQTYTPFVFTPSVRDILSDPQTRYYLWGRTWGDQDLRLLGHDLWAPMFVSDNWVIFRRMY